MSNHLVMTHDLHMQIVTYNQCTLIYRYILVTFTW